MRHHHIAQAAAVMLLCALALLQGCARREETAHVALIVSSSTGHYWENIIEGASTAAQRLGVEMTCYAPDEEAGVTLEMLPGMAVRDGAEALIAATQGEEELIAALAEANLPLVAVGTPISHTHLVSTILNDDAKMGSNIAKALAGELTAGDQVLLLADNAEYKPTERREYNLRQDLDRMGVKIRGRFYSGDKREWAYRQTLQQLYLWPELDAVVAFSAQSTVGASQAAEYLNRDLTIIGTDIIPDLIECIRDGSVSATIVRNSFGMGFLGVEYAAGALNGESQTRYKTLSSVVVTSDNLFTPEIEKVVFPYE